MLLYYLSLKVLAVLYEHSLIKTIKTLKDRCTLLIQRKRKPRAPGLHPEPRSSCTRKYVLVIQALHWDFV